MSRRTGIDGEEADGARPGQERAVGAGAGRVREDARGDCSPQGARRALSRLAPSGALAFLLTLAFTPLLLTAQASGDELGMSPFGQTMLTALAMLLAGAAITACEALARRGARRRPEARATGYAAASALPLLAGALALLVQAPAVPSTVAALTGVGCMAQLWLATRSWSREGVSQAEFAVAASLAGAAALIVALAAAPLLAYQSTALLCLAMGASGCALAAQDARRAGRFPEDGPEGDAQAQGRGGGAAGVAEGTAARSSLARVADGLRCDWQPLLGAVVCALSFGLSWNGVAAGVGGTLSAGVCLGEALGALALLALVAWRARRPDAWSPESPLALAAGVGILVWALAKGDGRSAALFSLASVSQMLLLGLLLVETQDTGRDLEPPGTLTMLGIMAFLVALLAGGALSFVVPTGVSDVAIPVTLFAFSGLVISAARRDLQRASSGTRRTRQGTSAGHDGDVAGAGGAGGSSPTGEDAQEGRGDVGAGESVEQRLRLLGTMLEDSCATMASDFGLSRRESEILPYLVRGISAPSIGARLFISPQTVKTHAHRIYAKTGTHSRDELSALFERYLTGDFRVEDDCGAARATGGGVEETCRDVFPR